MKIDLYKLIRKFLLIIIVVSLCFFNTEITLAGNNSNKVNIHPGAVKFDIMNPVSEVSGNHNLRIDRKGKTEKNVYYWIVDNSQSPIDLASYVIAKTPYNSTYQSLNKPVLFLAKEDNYASISLKFRIDNYFWINVPDGNYHFDLLSDRGKSVNVIVKVNKVSYMTVYPDRLNIFANKGPGTYQSQGKATVYINNMNNKWNLDIKANPLIYQGKSGKNPPVVKADDIYVSVDNKDNFTDLGDAYRLNGNNYGNIANVDLYFQVDVGYEHHAGNYSGQIVLTISSQ